MAREDFDQIRLFIAEALTEESSLLLSKDQANYLLNVLRVPFGKRFRVFDGVNGEFEAVLTGDRKRPTVKLGMRKRSQPKASPVRLLFAPLKHARLDYMVQKAVELGAGSLEPVMTRRTQATRVNLERMQANIIEAAEQCGVLAIPALAAPRSLFAAVDALDSEIALIFCDEEAETSDPIAALKSAAGKVPAILIGPEGGFDEEERDRLRRRAGCVRLSLGPRVLRADTAATAALALVQSTLGDAR